jgi:RNA recognition motif-containing protein
LLILELKQTLFHLFSQYGDILEVHARKSFRMKGQAFIIFRDLAAAASAKSALDNALIFGKNIKVNYSKQVSDVINDMSGKYVHKDKMKRDLERKRKRDAEYQELKNKGGQLISQKSDHKKERREEAPEKKEITQSSSQMMAPNNILFVENLSSEITQPILTTVFSKYGGFKEVRHYPGKGIAFVEFDNEVNAGGALIGLNGMNLTSECKLHISFAKK